VVSTETHSQVPASGWALAPKVHRLMLMKKIAAAILAKLYFMILFHQTLVRLPLTSQTASSAMECWDKKSLNFFVNDLKNPEILQ
jgi:hypothetical protein